MQQLDRTVARAIFDKWIGEQMHDGLLRLAEKSKVSASTIHKARLGRVPRRQSTRKKLCKALGVPEDKLFPLVGASGGVVS